MSARDVFTFLHLSFLTEKTAQAEGCSTVALSHSNQGPLVGKNRDYRGEHQALQRIFLHKDPAFGDKHCLCVGSLGAPGAFSSGMNSSGLALADTRIAWPQPGVGWLRYFLMTEILWQANTVAEAVELIRSVPHVGGGSISLADASGCIAVVELGAHDIAVEMRKAGGYVHTNHYVLDPLSAAMDKPSANDATSQSSFGRLQTLSRALPGLEEHASRTGVLDLLSTHAGSSDSLCRHASGGEEFTISSAIYACRDKSLTFVSGPPCDGPRQTFSF